MSDRDEDLKATAEDLIDDAEQLKRVEAQKLRLRPGDPKLDHLAEQASAIIRRMKPKGDAEEALVTEAETA
ncbi:hypothetical protein BH23CHL7_BH23CHL7_07920 [soil metagenome]